MPPTPRQPATSAPSSIRQVHTRSVPWRNWDEWHQVADALASTDPALRSLGAQHVAAWRCRGRVPAAIDATATLTQLLLYPSHRFAAPLFSPLPPAHPRCHPPAFPARRLAGALSHAPQNSPDALRLSLSMAITRCVNAVVDAQQMGDLHSLHFYTGFDYISFRCTFPYHPFPLPPPPLQSPPSPCALSPQAVWQQPFPPSLDASTCRAASVPHHALPCKPPNPATALDPPPPPPLILTLPHSHCSRRAPRVHPRTLPAPSCSRLQYHITPPQATLPSLPSLISNAHAVLRWAHDVYWKVPACTCRALLKPFSAPNHFFAPTHTPPADPSSFVADDVGVVSSRHRRCHCARL
jgi:hypothetical protein